MAMPWYGDLLIVLAVIGIFVAIYAIPALRQRLWDPIVAFLRAFAAGGPQPAPRAGRATFPEILSYCVIENRWMVVGMLLWVILVGVVLGSVSRSFDGNTGWILFLEILLMVIVPLTTFVIRQRPPAQGARGGAENCANILPEIGSAAMGVAWVALVLGILTVSYNRVGNPGANAAIAAFLMIGVPLAIWQFGRPNPRQPAAGQAAAGQGAAAAGQAAGQGAAVAANPGAGQQIIINAPGAQVPGARVAAGPGGGRSMHGGQNGAHGSAGAAGAGATGAGATGAGAGATGATEDESRVKSGFLYVLAIVAVAMTSILLVLEGHKYPFIGKSAKYIVYASIAGLLLSVLYKLVLKKKDLKKFFEITNFVDLIETTPFAGKLLAAEIAVFSVFYFYPDIRNQFAKIALPKRSKVFVEDPVTTSQATQVATYLELNDISEKSYPLLPQYNYTVGGWFFFNNVAGNISSENGGYVPVLDLGQSPTILWNAASGNLKITTRIAGGGVVTLYDDSVPMQKWNNIMVTFDAGTADVIINNELVGTRENTTPEQKQTPLTVGYTGSREIGAPGGVTNVVYSPIPISNYIVGLNYRLMAPSPGL